MKKYLFLTLASLVLGSHASAANFYCTVNQQPFYAVQDNLGYAIAFNVTIQTGVDNLSIYHTPGDEYFNVTGTLAGVSVSTSVAFNGEYPQQNVKFGSITLNKTELKCHLMK